MAEPTLDKPVFRYRVTTIRTMLWRRTRTVAAMDPIQATEIAKNIARADGRDEQEYDQNVIVLCLDREG